MAAYVIVDVVVHDPARYEEYKRLAGPTVGAYGGRYVVRGGAVDVLEGDWSAERIVVLEFPTAARAKEWWESTEYGEAKAIRYEAADSRLLIVEGV